MILVGDALKALREQPENSFQTCVTSPPYWGLRDYGVEGQLGLEKTPEEYVGKLVEVFREVRRVLRTDGTVWVNLGDSYAAGGRGGKGAPSGLKPKDLVGIPWRVAFALQADGWYLRSEIIWHKPNPMPESVTDRPTKAHEQIFLFAKSPKYYFDSNAIREPYAVSTLSRNSYVRSSLKSADTKGKRGGKEYQPRGEDLVKVMIDAHPNGRNRRTVWTVTTKSFKGAHFATFPPDLIEPCILAGSRPGDTVLDPFFGAGTTGLVALKHGREYVGIELNPAYAEMARERLRFTQHPMVDPHLPATDSL